MNKRDSWFLWIIFPSIPFAVLQPVTTGPLIFALLLKPMSLASQSLGILTKDAGKTPWLGYSIPDWFNDCLEDSNKIYQDVDVTNTDLETPVRKLRAFLACSVIFCIFQVIASCLYVWYNYLDIRRRQQHSTTDNYEKVAKVNEDPEARFYNNQ